MSLANLAISKGRRSADSGPKEGVDIITFVEAPWGLALKLFPVQRVILKAHYGMELDDNPYGFPLEAPVPKGHPDYDPDLVDRNGYYKYRIPITDFRRENSKVFTEAGYLRYLFDDGRSNVREVIPGVQRREMVLSVGRRSGKTLITSCIIAYEAYKLLLKGNPQKYYGSSQSNVIQLISVATDRDQAALLYREASGHFNKCSFFKAYEANSTQSYATFQTPYDIDKYGSYKDNPKARFSLNVTFRSCVAKGLRGGANILVALDEVAHFTDAGQSSADEVYQAVEPSTRTFSPKDPLDTTVPVGENEGRIILISSPLGRQGLFYKQFQLGFGSNQAADNLLCIQAPTWEVNPTVPAATFVGSYLKDPRIFETEFGAVFSDRTRGWITSQKDLVACIDPDLRPRMKGPPRAPHFMGLDIGLAGDGSAIAVGHMEEDGAIVVDLVDQIKAGVGDYEGRERLDFDEVAAWIQRHTQKFYIHKGMFDQYAGIPLEQALAKRGLGQFDSVHHTRNLNSQMYQNFKDMMYDNRLRLYNWPIPEGEGKDFCPYIQELLELQAHVVSKNITLVQAPQIEGKHDDMSDALVRMIWLASNHKGKIIAFATGATRNPGGAVHGSLARGIMRRQQSGSHPSRQIPKRKRRG